MKTLIHFVANSHQISHLTIAKMICNALIEHLGNSEFNIKNFWINEKIVDIILTPLINWSQQQQQNYMAINLCRLTEIILSSETGIGKLYSSEDKKFLFQKLVKSFSWRNFLNFVGYSDWSTQLTSQLEAL